MDYKMGVPLDNEYLIQCSIIKKELDKKGRTKVTVRAQLCTAVYDGGLEVGSIHSTGEAAFVIVPGTKWPGQPLKARASL